MSSHNENKRDRKIESGSGRPGDGGHGPVIGSQIPDPRILTPVFKSYRDLEVWQKSMDLVVNCYQLTRSFPKYEVFGLASQIQRAVVSIAANIAEGRARQHTKEFLQHLSIAHGSLAELETLLLIAERLEYISAKSLEELMNKTSTIGRMLNGLRTSLKNKERI